SACERRGMRNAVIVGLLSTCLMGACGNEVNLQGSGGHPPVDAGPEPEDAEPPLEAGQPDGGDAGACMDTPDLGCSGCWGDTNCGCETEAAAMVQAIAEAAVTAYQAKGTLCASAAGTVPQAGPPEKMKYLAGTFEGQDFATGDEATGWKCLGFD